MFKEYDTVRITTDHIEHVAKGETGVVLMVFDNPKEVYEVEILGEDGKTKVQCTLRPDDMELA